MAEALLELMDFSRQRRSFLKRIALLSVAVSTAVGVVAYMAPVAGHADGEASPIFSYRNSADTATGS